MIEVISTFFESLIETFIMSCLAIICLILGLLGFMIYPIKKARIFLGRQLNRVADTMDYYLTETLVKDYSEDNKNTGA